MKQQSATANAKKQVDWDAVHRNVAGNDFAVVFLLLLGRLGVVETGSAG